MKIRIYGVAIIILILSLLGCDMTERDWEQTSSTNTIAAYEAYINNHPDSKHVETARDKIQTLKYESAKASNNLVQLANYVVDYPNSPHYAQATSQMENIANDYLQKSFRAIAFATSPGKTILDPAEVDQTGYGEAKRLLDEILAAFPGHAIAENNRAVMAAEEGDIDKASSMLEHAVNKASDTAVDDVTLEIGITSADNKFLSYFSILQPASEPNQDTSHTKDRSNTNKNDDPLTVTLHMSTVGAAQLASIKASPCKHVVVDKINLAYQLKREIKNNLQSVKALVDPKERKRCWNYE